MAETKNEKLRFSIYKAFATALLVLICLTVYICVHFNAAIFSTRHTETYSIIKADTFDTINDNTTPLGIYNELAFTLPAIPKNGSNLVFFVKHESVEVYIDENLVYSIAPDNSSFIHTTGANWCIIPIYPDDTGSIVRIKLSPLYNSMNGTQPTIYLGSQYKIYEHLLIPNIIIYLTCLLAVLCGLFFILFTVINLTNPHVDKSLLMVGTFSLLIGIWKFMDLDYTALIIRNSIVLSYTSYFCLLMMTIPFISFLL